MHCQGSSGGGRFNCSNCLLQCVSERKEFARPWERDVRLAGVRQYGLGRPNNHLLLCNHSVTSVSITWKMQQFFFSPVFFSLHPTDLLGGIRVPCLLPSDLFVILDCCHLGCLFIFRLDIKSERLF